MAIDVTADGATVDTTDGAIDEVDATVVAERTVVDTGRVEATTSEVDVVDDEGLTGTRVVVGATLDELRGAVVVTRGADVVVRRGEVVVVVRRTVVVGATTPVEVVVPEGIVVVVVEVDDEVVVVVVAPEAPEFEPEATLLVTDCPDSDAASLPAESWRAFASLPPVGSAYATVMDWPAPTADANVSTTVEPDTDAEDTDRDTPSTSTVYAEVPAVVADNASEYVKVMVVPPEFVAAETNVGDAVSTVDEFVTDVEPIDPTSLPAESCTAFVSSPAVGSEYVKVTLCPLSMAGVVAKMTSDPDTVTDVGVRATPSTTIENRAAVAVVAERDSENDSVTCVPAVFTAAELNVGADVSRVIVVVAVEADDGPVFPAPSVPPPEANLGCTVPSPQLDTVIV